MQSHDVCLQSLCKQAGGQASVIHYMGDEDVIYVAAVVGEGEGRMVVWGLPISVSKPP